MSERRRVVVLYGGRSAEHEISCISARSVIDALDPARNEVIPVGITKEGRWRLQDAPPALPAETGRMPEIADGSGTDVELARDRRGLVRADGTWAPVDVVFPVLHGPFGEDGTVQGLLELAGVPYVGAGVTASAVGMDKAMQKALWVAAGLPIVPHEVVREPEWEEDPEGVLGRVAALGSPVFVKPATLGSSVGITKVRAPEELDAAMAEAFRYARKLLVERASDGSRELECAILGNDDPVASVCGEIVPRGHEFYDYDAKYLDEQGAELRIPAPVPPGVQERAQRLAVAAFRAIDAAGMARVDLFLTADGKLVLNEINTIPGFTSISMYPKLWAASGLAYPELVERLLQLAVERSQAEWGKSLRPRELEAGRSDVATGAPPGRSASA